MPMVRSLSSKDLGIRGVYSGGEGRFVAGDCSRCGFPARDLTGGRFCLHCVYTETSGTPSDSDFCRRQANTCHGRLILWRHVMQNWLDALILFIPFAVLVLLAIQGP